MKNTKIFLTLTVFVFALLLVPQATKATEVEEQLDQYVKDVQFLGMLVELGSTTAPTNLVVRISSATDELTGDVEGDVTVEVTTSTVLGQRKDQYTKLEDWIPGDRIRVIGHQDENTGVVTASVLVNHSISTVHNWGSNGWITEIDTDNDIVSVQWQNKTYQLQVTENTRIVAPPKNPAEITDLKVGDRIRGRVLARLSEGIAVEAKIIVVLRRGNDIFLGIRTGIVHGEILSMEGTEAPTTMTVKIKKNNHLKKNDTNNLIGVEGDTITVNITEDTVIVRKYFGQTDLTEFVPGDSVMIIGKAQGKKSDKTIEARLIRNKDIFLASTQGHSGEIQSIDVSTNRLTVKWQGKTWRVDIGEETQIVKDNNTSATIEDLEVGDLIRARGLYHKTLRVFQAKVIVVVDEIPDDAENPTAG